MPVVAIEHIEVNEDGVARICGKRTKVIHLVMDKLANNWGPDELHRQYPHLSLGEIHAAFAYYYDHQEHLDAQIQQDLKEAEALRTRAGESPLVQKLRSLGKLP